MTDLLDIAPSLAVEVVKVNGGKRITVQRIGADGIAYLVGHFPDLVLLLGGGINEKTANHILTQVGAATCSIIAVGCGHIGDEKYEKAAGSFLAEDQLKLLAAILRVSFPNGLVPFMEAMASLVKGTIPQGLEKPVKIRSRKSPSPSPSSFDPASRQTMQ